AKTSGLWGYIFAEPEIADAHCVEAVELARQVDDHMILANALLAQGAFHVMGPDLRRGVLLLEEAVGVAREHGDQLNLIESLTWLALAELTLGEFDQAETLGREAVAKARVIGVPLYLGFAKTVLGASLTWRGAYVEAETVIEEAVALARELGLVLVLAFALVFRIRLAQATGAELDEAESDEAVSLAEVMELSILVSNARVARGAAALQRGRIEIARTEFGEALTEARRSKSNWLVSQALNGLAILARATGELEAAEAHAYDSLATAASGGVPAGVADGLALLGGLAIERQDWLRAARLLGASETVRASVGCERFLPSQRAYEADSAAAREKVGEAEFKRACEEGMAMSTEDALTYAAKGRGSRHRPPTGWASLTPVEQQVVRLVGEGLTNPQIGERLFISKRTVQAHLSRIFGKLGVSSRSELASAAAKRGMVATKT
ncbi:MAG: LuxR C-terminal-related transcriptional regulator, partial [Candidatus Dormibacteraeota bacterium]|nr:LuxR C-terminal-related transcriptional regulator [Candidatus Dormibacteraeota bacterium]